MDQRNRVMLSEENINAAKITIRMKKPHIEYSCDVAEMEPTNLTQATLVDDEIEFEGHLIKLERSRSKRARYDAKEHSPG